MSNQNEAITRFLTEWTDAELKGDAAALGRLLTDDFVGVGPLGFMLPKQAWLGRYMSGDFKYTAFRLDEVQTRLYGDAALVTAHQVGEATMKGNPVPFGHVRAMLALVNQSGGWRLAGIQMSFIAGTPGAPPVPEMP
ncbi:MAG: nuclear transport factor 2 family protein [Dehalococcoidia bacterium]